MAFGDTPKTQAFSLGDLHEYDRCVFSFFVKHHLGKKYELAEGNFSQAIGTLMDLAIKKLHLIKGYDQTAEYLATLIKAAEAQIKEDVAKRGKNSFYGAQIEFLTPEVIIKAQEIFLKYCQAKSGKFKKYVLTPISQKPKPFWEHIIPADIPLKMWGGPDALEMGEDGVPEIVDYKYFQDIERGRANLDMDLMPKVYTLLCAEDLKRAGFKKTRFVVRFWQDPEDESFYEEFDLNLSHHLEDYLKDKIERIMRTSEITFCERDYCIVCHHQDREKWVQEIENKGWVKKVPEVFIAQASPDLPF